jgi:hypothetical protein
MPTPAAHAGAHHPRPSVRRHRGPTTPGPPTPGPTTPDPASGPGAAASGDGQPDAEALCIEWRNQAIDRMHKASSHHAFHALERAHTDPIAPHALVFFYLDDHPGANHRLGVRAASRLWVDIPDVESAGVPGLLWRYASAVADCYATVRFDPRHHQATWRDDMSGHARYFGVGVSTLDVPGHSWHQQRTSFTPYQIVCHCFGILSDGTHFLLHRGSSDTCLAPQIWSSTNLDVSYSSSFRRWRWARHLPDLVDPGRRDWYASLPELTHPMARDVWQPLHRLHRVLTAATTRGGGHVH